MRQRSEKKIYEILKSSKRKLIQSQKNAQRNGYILEKKGKRIGRNKKKVRKIRS